MFPEIIRLSPQPPLPNKPLVVESPSSVMGARGGGWKVEINLNVLNKGRQNIDSLYSVEEGISIYNYRYQFIQVILDTFTAHE